MLKFKNFKLPDNKAFFIPDDVDLKLPEKSDLDSSQLHFLAYIPWDDKYLQYVDKEYLNFFKFVLPYLAVRTSDVHTAICLPFVKNLVKEIGRPVKERLIYTSFILHDIGWSRMSEKEIAVSLGVEGLALTGDSAASKEKHAFLGADITKKILSDFSFNPPLTKSEKELICKSVLYHDRINDLRKRRISLESKIVADIDHFWSFTHLNFWQDTVRKGIDPVLYWNNLNKDLESYFITPEGAKLASRLLKERKNEVKEWKEIKKL